MALTVLRYFIMFWEVNHTHLLTKWNFFPSETKEEFYIELNVKQLKLELLARLLNSNHTGSLLVWNALLLTIEITKHLHFRIRRSYVLMNVFHLENTQGPKLLYLAIEIMSSVRLRGIAWLRASIKNGFQPWKQMLGLEFKRNSLIKVSSLFETWRMLFLTKINVNLSK